MKHWILYLKNKTNLMKTMYFRNNLKIIKINNSNKMKIRFYLKFNRSKYINFIMSCRILLWKFKNYSKYQFFIIII